MVGTDERAMSALQMLATGRLLIDGSLSPEERVRVQPLTDVSRRVWMRGARVKRTRFCVVVVRPAVPHFRKFLFFGSLAE